MRRILMVTIAALAAFVGVAGNAQAAKKPIKTYCSPSGDFCQTVFRNNGRFKAQIATFSYRGKIQICVKYRSKNRKCKKFRLRQSKSGIYESKVNLSKNFKLRKRGKYSVTWRSSGTRIGRTLRFRKR